MTEDNIDDLLNELKDTKKMGTIANIRPPLPTEQPAVTDENLNEFVLQKMSLVISQGVATLEEIKNGVRQSADPEEIDAYSKLINAVASTADTLNKVNLQNKKAATAKEIKQMEIKGKSPEGLPSSSTTIVIATREEIMERILKEAEDSTIDITSEVIDSESVDSKTA
jgi:hypothetical protein